MWEKFSIHFNKVQQPLTYKHIFPVFCFHRISDHYLMVCQSMVSVRFELLCGWNILPRQLADAHWKVIVLQHKSLHIQLFVYLVFCKSNWRQSGDWFLEKTGLWLPCPLLGKEDKTATLSTWMMTRLWYYTTFVFFLKTLSMWCFNWIYNVLTLVGVTYFPSAKFNVWNYIKHRRLMSCVFFWNFITESV